MDASETQGVESSRRVGSIGSVDVAILGGGLAGLCLALQLKLAAPHRSVAVFERKSHPVPEAAHKVGESTVEIGAHYFDTVLRLREHLQSKQIRKFGFRFFFSEGESDLSKVLEVGVRRAFLMQSYQVDRGIFENALGEMALKAGVVFIDGAMVRAIDVSEGEAPHQLRYSVDGHDFSARARWLVDASGRAGYLKRKLDLAEGNNHNANAVWFRINDRIDIDQWSAESEWSSRCTPPERWRSTNHLVGKGYWVWLIPLSSGAHSVGIVADAVTHPISTMNTFDKAMSWLAKYQPRLHEDLLAKLREPAKPDVLMDFHYCKNFSYSCKQVFNGKARWALTGEAGVFADPYYSPGSDSIAMSNTFITELIREDFAGRDVTRLARLYEHTFFTFFRTTMSLYEGQYDLFGDPEVLPLKILWDYAYYWGVLTPLFISQRITDGAFLSHNSRALVQSQTLNAAVQPFFREWSKHSQKRNAARIIDQQRVEWFAALNEAMCVPMDDAALSAHLNASADLLARLVVAMVQHAKAGAPALDSTALDALVARITPSAAPQGEDLLREFR